MKTKTYFKGAFALLLAMVIAFTAMPITLAFADYNGTDYPSVSYDYSTDEYVGNYDANNPDKPSFNEVAPEDDVYIPENDDELIYTPEEDVEYDEVEVPANNLPESDTTIVIGRSGSVIDASDFESEYLGSRAMTRSANGWLMGATGFLTFQGQQRIYGPIQIFPGEVIHVQAEMPNSAAIDYDLYLLIMDNSGNLHFVDSSEYDTLINGVHGTLPEAVGAVNRTGAIQNYFVMVQSFRGSSNTLPYRLHIGFNVLRDNLEADENAFHSTPISLQASGNTVINNRQMNTLADNDWFRFEVPANRTFDSLSLTLDNVSNVAGHRVEMYTMTNTGGMRKIVPTNDMFAVTTGTHFVRVTALGANFLTGTNYTLTISTEGAADNRPGSPSNPIPLSWYRDSVSRAGITIGDTLPCTEGIFFSFRGGEPAITLVSPHAGLRFRVYDAERLRLGQPNYRVFSSHNGGVSGVRNANRGRVTRGFGVAGTSVNGYVQKVNRNESWRFINSNREYFIVVYTHPSFVNTTNPVGNGREFFLGVGDPFMAQGTYTTDSTLLSGSGTWIGNTWRMSSSVNVLNRGFESRNHPYTARVTRIDLQNGTVPLTRWSFSANNPSASNANVSRNGASANSRQSLASITMPNTQMRGNWMLTFEGTVSPNATQGSAIPVLWFTYTFEIGD